eukprot:TRINITY_DN45428_c0_g1_i1.p1 TRINITY_DN45428_c0_g1~~TRINITY_DN45428_c0_g1_i1.p1  ORF type:complete len:238 (-),score=35.96 TRINITY_DN45428_c0_g1_i1:31-744(-)
MGVDLSRLQVVGGLEPLASFSITGMRELFKQYDTVCPTPALWERAFFELMGCWDNSPEACSKAFQLLDVDANGLIDAREVMAGMCVLSRGHLKERMTLLFEMFDLNQEGSISFDDCKVMLTRTLIGLQKLVGNHLPPEAIIEKLTLEIWKSARRHRASRVSMKDWHIWWSHDSVVRAVLKTFTHCPEEESSLPTPDQFVTVNYAKGINQDDNGNPFVAMSRFVPRSQAQASPSAAVS